MVIFIDDRPVRILKKSKAKSLQQDEDFDLILDARLQTIRVEKFIGHTCLLNVTANQLEKVVLQLHEKSDLKFSSLYVICENKKEAKSKVKALYQMVEAAGGVVVNEETKVLWIHRLGKWDLPKGKLEKGEKFKVAAIREVKEECNVDANLIDKICSTYHTYTHKNQLVLKKTKWYLMKSKDQNNLTAQTEENIDKVEWQTVQQMNKSMTNTYSSIRYVIQNFQLLGF
ncbi:NUDIX domain-containing protein [Sandaracinomonas limnophila]|uniref:NUDIX domain-containing protein n=1 Tax=Sandaracinomonas limnophila TaxID=1862386 RepID=A0A437PX94_9BACT|nr:NUDIX domain-containing protein [Sandaracinomonas limnophila]RVU26860.1 NUDIX domain-containing protein [Sandaracinomonas limnophila]